MTAQTMQRFLIGLATLSMAAIWFSQSRVAADDKEQKPTTLTSGQIDVCPKYPYMNHGTYISYYSFVHDRDTNMCVPPISYDSATQPNLNGDCQTGVNCLGPFQLTRARAKNASKHRSHEAAEKLKIDGIDPSTEPTNIPQAGAEIQNTGVYIIEFTKNPNGGKLFKAKVALVKLTPGKFKPPLTGDSIEVGVGQSIQSADPADRSSNNGDVITLDREKHVVQVLVKIENNEWREYQIVLRKGEGVGP